MKSKKRLKILGGLITFITIIGVGYVFFTKLNSTRVTIDLLHTEENHLRKEAIDWYTSQKNDHGIYVLSSTSTSDYLVYYNKNVGKNLYLTPRVKSTLVNGNLVIQVVEENATNDHFVKDRLLAHIKLEKTPKNIEISVSGKRIEPKIETIDRIFAW